MPSIQRRLIVFSKGKPEHTYTADWLNQSNFKKVLYVVSDDDDVKAYKKSTGFDVVKAAGSFNLASKRQWALENTTSRVNPWMIFAEDNIRKMIGVKPKFLYGCDEVADPSYDNMRGTDYDVQTVFEVINKDILKARELGAYYGGFASTNSHLFRRVKYKTVSFIWSKFGYCRNRGPSWPDYVNEKDDYGFTAECLKFSGRTLKNNFMFPEARRYENRGGSRSLEDRADDMREAVQQFHKRFPGLFRNTQKKHGPEGTEVQLRFNSHKQIDAWRNAL